MPPLFSPEELDLLDSLDYREDAVLKESSRLRGLGLEPERVSALLTQARLRRDARAKLGPDAAGMLFTRNGLEQATRDPVARLHARRLREAGIASVADLGCGIGADARAFARAGLEVLAVEIDPTTAGAAAHNLAGFHGAAVHRADVESLDLSALPVQALWLDPARREPAGGRGTSRRLFDPEAFSPPFSLILRLAAGGMPMGVKMGPGMDRSSVPAEAEAQWISHGGEVVELVLWFNALARPGVRRAATVLAGAPSSPGADEPVAELVSGTGFGQEPEPRIEAPGAYLYEPDGAVVRAELVQELARAVDGWLLDPRIAYVGSDTARSLPWATGWRVLAELPLHTRTIRQWIREHGVGAVTIKKRGVDVVPETLRRQLLAGSGRTGARGGRKNGPAGEGGPAQGASGRNGAHATLVLTRWDTPGGERRACFVVEPLARTQAPDPATPLGPARPTDPV